MVNEQNHQADDFLGSSRKSYSAMKISQLGDLSGLTQANNMAPYSDGATMMLNPPRP
jgi:hypothetical protein